MIPKRFKEYSSSWAKDVQADTRYGYGWKILQAYNYLDHTDIWECQIITEILVI